MNVKFFVTMEAYKVMPVPFVISEKEIFAVHGAVIVPPLFCFLYSLTFWVMVASIGNVVIVEIIKNYVFSVFHIR